MKTQYNVFLFLYGLGISRTLNFLNLFISRSALFNRDIMWDTSIYVIKIFHIVYKNKKETGKTNQ